MCALRKNIVNTGGALDLTPGFFAENGPISLAYQYQKKTLALASMFG
jgi:hypothetical protein